MQKHGGSGRCLARQCRVQKERHKAAGKWENASQLSAPTTFLKHIALAASLSMIMNAVIFDYDD